MRNLQTFLPMETPPLRVGMCPLRMETPPLRMGTCPFRMETPLRGRSGGHTGAAPTISRVVHVPRLADEALPMGKNEGGCVAEGFDGGW